VTWEAEDSNHIKATLTVEGEAATSNLTIGDEGRLQQVALKRYGDQTDTGEWAGERTRILAVDDETRILSYLERTLEEAGYQAVVTSDPAEVAQLVELEGPDLLLLDLMMPGTSGFELRRVLSDQVEVRPPLVLDGLTINFVQRRVTVNGQPVSLSATEYKILYELASHAGMVLTHGQILQRVWGPEYSGETELVRSFIRNLRRKLGDEESVEISGCWLA